MGANHDKWTQLGDCTCPLGQNKEWVIHITEKRREDNLMGYVYARMNQGEAYVPPGKYKALGSKVRNCPVMSNTPFEISTNLEAYNDATGGVLINGLGMGMLLEALLHKPEVEAILVQEISPSLIKLVGDYYLKEAERLGWNRGPRSKQFSIQLRDAFQPRIHPEFKYDYVWHDIWDTISPANLDEMTELGKLYRRYAKKQGFWTRDYNRRQMKRDGGMTMDDMRRIYRDEIAALAARRQPKEVTSG